MGNHASTEREGFDDSYYRWTGNLVEPALVDQRRQYLALAIRQIGAREVLADGGLGDAAAFDDAAFFVAIQCFVGQDLGGGVEARIEDELDLVSERPKAAVAGLEPLAGEVAPYDALEVQGRELAFIGFDDQGVDLGVDVALDVCEPIEDEVLQARQGLWIGYERCVDREQSRSDSRR